MNNNLFSFIHVEHILFYTTVIIQKFEWSDELEIQSLTQNLVQMNVRTWQEHNIKLGAMSWQGHNANITRSLIKITMKIVRLMVPLPFPWSIMKS